MRPLGALRPRASRQFLKPGTDQRSFAKAGAGCHKNERFVEATIQPRPQVRTRYQSPRLAGPLQLGVQEGKVDFNHSSPKITSYSVILSSAADDWNN